MVSNGPRRRTRLADPGPWYLLKLIAAIVVSFSYGGLLILGIAAAPEESRIWWLLAGLFFYFLAGGWFIYRESVAWYRRRR